MLVSWSSCLLKTSAILYVFILTNLHHSNALRGAPPDLETVLQSHSCVLRDAPRNPPVQLPLNRINDNYCDCDDGSDEPGTAACPSATFWCRNVKHVASNIPSAWVDDGHCDCCDGSDESSGKCPDRCEQLRGEARENATRTAAVIMKGVAARASYVKEVQNQMNKDKKEIEKLETQLKQLEIKYKESEKRAERLNKQREFEEKLQEATQVTHEEKNNIDEHSVDPADEDLDDDYEKFDEESDDNDDDNTDDQVDNNHQSDDSAAIDQNGDKKESDGDKAIPDQNVDSGPDNADSRENSQTIEQLEVKDGKDDIHDENENNENAEKDEHIKELKLDDVTHDVDIEDETDKDENLDANTDGNNEQGNGVAGHDDEFSGEDLDAVCAELESRGSNAIMRKLTYIRAIAVYKLHRILPSLIKPLTGSDTGSIYECAQRADNKKWELQSEKSELERKIKELKDKEKIDYGSDLALRKLHGSCIKTKVLQYEFEHCPFDLVRQYEHGSPIATLGKFKNWEQNGDSRVMVYSEGDQCWNGPSRSIKVSLSCGETEDIISVDEPNRCTYEMKFKTPAVCEKEVADSILSQFHTSENPKEEL